MTNTKVTTSREILISAHDALSNSLTFLINQTSSLNDEVKTHCKQGLKVVGIILADLKYDIGTHLLMEKEFDQFFACFPAEYYNKRKENRKWICVYTVAKHIESCIETNQIVYSSKDKAENSLI